MSILVELGEIAGLGTLSLDLALLLRTRLLLEASSGGGKSYALRGLAERLWGKVPVIILDPEGEFASLREVAGYFLVGKGGEAAADPRSAGRVVRRLLEIRASAVCDLYEMSEDARHAWVSAAATALVEAPKSLWKPVVVMLDEAHVFAPERGLGESPARIPITDLATRGRKRGQCLVAATPRLSILSKTVAAMLQNKLVGLTTEAVDVDSAARQLGIRRRDFGAFERQVQDLDPGRFLAKGRAFRIGSVAGGERLRELVTVIVGPVASSHPDVDEAPLLEPPPLPSELRRLLPKLVDLPADEAPSVAGSSEEVAGLARGRLAELEEELREARAVVAAGVAVVAERDGARAALAAAHAGLEAVSRLAGEALEAIGEEAEKARPHELAARAYEDVAGGAVISPPHTSPSEDQSSGSHLRSMAAREILRVAGVGLSSRADLALWAGLRPGGHLARGFAELLGAGLMVADGGMLQVTEDGSELRRAIGGGRRPTRAGVVATWEPKLSPLERAAWERVRLSHRPLPAAEISGMLGRKGGHFARAVSSLVRSGLASRDAKGRLVPPQGWLSLPER